MQSIWRKPTKKYIPTKEIKHPLNIGDVVESLVPLTSEDNVKYPIGTKFRVVDIAAKVLIHKYIDEYHDHNEFFLNLVEEKQENDYNRTRCNFCCVRKVK
jgi:hypothetical protein